MIDKNFLHPASKQTHVEGGSSYTNPSGRLNRETLGGDESGSRNDSSFDDPGRGLSGRNTALASEGNGSRDGSRYESGNDAPLSSERPRELHDTRSGLASERPREPYDERRDRTEGAVGGGLAGASGATAARSQHRYDGQHFNSERQGMTGDLGQTRNAGTQGSTGLETQNPHAAAAQAGALLDREDIRKIDRKTEAGKMAGGPGVCSVDGVGFDSSMEPGGSSRGMVGEGVGSTGLVSTEGQGLDSTGEPGSVSGEHMDELFDPRKLQGQDGLIHGHHTTATGEKLDPHLKR